MLYFDTSFLAPLIRQERTSSAVERFVAELTAEEPAVSHWTRVEFSSVLARDVRMGNIELEAAHEVDAKFETILASSFIVLLPAAADFDLAKTYLARPETGLRAGDAFHLAIAANNRATAIYSLDRTLLKAGKMLGLPVSMGIRAA